MIITCEKCEKRYLVKAEDIRENGRQVRCVACGHSWFQPPPESAKSLMQDSPAEEIFYEKVIDRKISKTSSVLMIFITLFFFILALGYLARREIVKLWPESVMLYQKIGLSVVHYETGLKLVNIEPSPIEENNQSALMIRGELLNTSKAVQAIPPLKIELLGPCNQSSAAPADKEKSLCVVKSWNHRFAESRILPGEKINFETEPKENLPAATDIRVGF